MNRILRGDESPRQAVLAVEDKINTILQEAESGR